MTMHLRSTGAVLVVVALAACIEPLEPKLTLRENDEEMTSIADNCAGADFPIVSGQAFYLYHSLPEGVIPPEPLQIDLETVCGNFPREVDHVDDDSATPLRVPLAAPPGAECGVTVTATIANSTIRCELEAVDKTGCDAQCPETEGTEETDDTEDSTT
jgi:hypothetical protein